MEEVDSILLSQLREIGCDLDDENISGIASLDAHQIMKCVATCLQRIHIDDDSITIPDPSTIISDNEHNIGYKSDIGYQTFLYSNEHEIRRLLLYLVEQISADSDEKLLSSPDQHPSMIDGSCIQISSMNESNEQQQQTEGERKTNEQQIVLEKLRQELRDYETEIQKCKINENELNRLERQYQEQYKLFEASFKSKEELENSIKMMKESIEEIALAWDEMQKDLLENLKRKKQQNMIQNEEQMEKIRLINTMKRSIASKLKEIQSKELMIKDMEQRQPQQWPPNRGSYTRRIIEIIQNVKKQNDETLKVVAETKAVQKDINNLNGKIERSFTIADEVLFREARQNEWNRQCYKLLALLQSTFHELLQAINEIGIHLREIRKLEEMIENENNRKTSANLIRINADLEQIRLENRQLKQKIRDASSSSSS
ncbi:Coiled-coil domain-containing protein 22 [Dermatophagoides pteronyssinus]|uniref:Coiled-coil domain-containing protein 22 homolog n=1 Tax=Dermatophagoides pteronyssinus TaxID=6956 RepID=A0ABQ8JDT1_DERPT|nr:Coiled-coil domain-containing protein 22 [Dermatophagoides pteronyssinus]